ncbi:ABC transporter permease [Pseudomonas gingeri]|uniref:ABC transporter permease n=1 Tax=Pseudomonas gingeri TaxID=117681 RepID=UPI0015A0EA64|nr:ABC transporter permease [Pseudomonas gingeri]NVZ99136.1 ABC transporter permease [Pseudomonas gingeri]NWA13181.1 ABC transporter permease [Pseudomonas gingeri]NWA55442.1 ABC transporter permease [Pseudomonas gingeri]NWA95704.1 ABC transporter permease [Pseudomonas gingeri]NWB00792.1 ABC transporter permease [Pseudomonas gingeri]
MSTLSVKNRRSAVLLVVPLFLFMLAFFLWPLGTVMQQAVSDRSVLDVLPLTREAATGWDGQSLPGPGIQQAFVTDIRNISDQQAIGEMVRRLNSAAPGFRTLIGKTQAAVLASDGPVDLASVDSRWADLRYWQTVRDALAPVTDRFLLASVDLQRDSQGQVVAMPGDASANRTIMIRTFSMTATITVLCLLLGYPYAVLLASVSGGWRNLLLGAVLLPLWTSLLVRTTAWFIVLQDNGIVNRLLMLLHLTDRPTALVFNRTGVIIAMVHVLLPLMVLPIYSVIMGIPRNLMPAAGSLGANPFRAFLEVLLPLSARGITSGVLLVFMSAIGYYITPALIGGPKDQMISSVIAFYATGAANWGMASALGLVLLVITIVLYAVYQRLSNREQETAE